MAHAAIAGVALRLEHPLCEMSRGGCTHSARRAKRKVLGRLGIPAVFVPREWVEYARLVAMIVVVGCPIVDTATKCKPGLEVSVSESSKPESH